MKFVSLATIILLPTAALAYPQWLRRQFTNDTMGFNSTTNGTGPGSVTTVAATVTLPMGTGVSSSTFATVTASVTTTSSGSSVSSTSTATATGSCTPGTYQCRQDSNGSGWNVCDTTSTWVNGGSCVSGQTCSFNPANNSPYCY